MLNSGMKITKHLKTSKQKRRAKSDSKLRKEDNEKFKDKQAKRRAKSDAKLKDSNPKKLKYKLS